MASISGPGSVFQALNGLRPDLQKAWGLALCRCPLRFQARSYSQTPGFLHISEPSPMPRVANITIWSSMIPKFLRTSSQKPTIKRPKGWNPATFFIVVFLLIGSQSIRIIAEQRDILVYTRKADAKLELLRKVLESLRRGEDVDVEKMLGTGDEEKEREWEDVIKELESFDSIWHTQVRREENRRRKAKEDAASELDASPVNAASKDNTDGKPSAGNFY